jgi:hypothetical protein
VPPVNVPSRIYQRLTLAQRVALEQRVKGLQALTERWLTDVARGRTRANAERARETPCADTDQETASEPRHSA